MNYLLSVMKGQQQGIGAMMIVVLLWPLSVLYGIGVFCHRSYFWIIGSYKAPKPVISIGNITAGGSGKTPLVIWLAKRLQDKGFKSVILTRGYMPKASKVSDEVDMLNEQIPFIPVLSGANRVHNIQQSQNVLPVDIYICDDAFQHWPLRRDLNIVAIDSNNPFGNGHLLPAGILREGLSALKRADVFILTKIDDSSDVQILSSRLKKINPKALIMESRYQSSGVKDIFSGEVLSADYLKNLPVVGFCAIGDPISFQSELRNSGAQIKKTFVYRDHHVYQKKDIARMIEFCREQAVPILVTTHKDAVKLTEFKDLFYSFRLVYLPIQLEVTKGADEFFQKINSIYFS